jgi:hypothetical protein
MRTEKRKEVIRIEVAHEVFVMWSDSIEITWNYHVMRNQARLQHNIVRGLFPSLQANAGIVLRFGSGCFLTNPFKLICHLTIRRYNLWAAKLLLNVLLQKQYEYAYKEETVYQDDLNTNGTTDF